MRVGPEANNQVLFEVAGIDHPFDGKIFLADVRHWNDNIDITIKYQNKPWVIATKRAAGWSGGFTVYLPGTGPAGSEFLVYYNKERSENCTTQWLLNAYVKQAH